jgi:hypothetical protein
MPNGPDSKETLDFQKDVPTAGRASDFASSVPTANVHSPLAGADDDGVPNHVGDNVTRSLRQ